MTWYAVTPAKNINELHSLARRKSLNYVDFGMGSPILYSYSEYYRPFSGGMASWLATAIYVAMVMPIYMTILIIQEIQISNMKVIDQTVDFKKNCQTLAFRY